MATTTIPIPVEQEVERAFATSPPQLQQDIQQVGQQMISSALGFLHLSSSGANNRALYEEDFYAWTQKTAGLIRAGKWYDLDWKALAEEVESLGASQYTAVSSAVYQALVHLLKWRYQSARQSRSWRVSLVEHRNRIPRRLRRTPSLAREIPKMIEEEYPAACRKASAQTGLPLATFPETCPWTPEQVLDDDFWPEGEPTP